MTRHVGFVFFICGLFLFSIGQSHEIIGFESRFYVFALEMWRHGPNWFPTTYQTFYPDYPVTSTLFIYLLAKLTGGLTRCAALFPSIVASSLTLSVTYLIGALYNRTWGIAAAFFLLMTYGFVNEARTISLDQFTTLFTALAFYLAASAEVLQKPQRFGWIFVCLVAGFAFRGPIGLVIPTGVVALYYLLEKDYKRFFLFIILAGLLFAICSAILLGIAYHAGGYDLLQSVLEKEVLGRLHDTARVPAWYFYFVESLGAYAIAYPLAILVCLGLISSLNYSANTRFLKKIMGWAFIILIGLTIPNDKKIRYILPAIPAFALLCGYLFIVAREKSYLFLLKKIFLVFCFLLPILSLIGVYAFHVQNPGFALHYHTALIILIILCLLLLLVYKRELFVFGVAVLSFLTVIIYVVEPINIQLNTTKKFVLQVEKLRQLKQAKLVFYQIRPDGLVIKYMANMPQETIPLFAQEESELKKLKPPFFVISTIDALHAISKKNRKKFRVIERGNLGREPVVVVYRAS